MLRRIFPIIFVLTFLLFLLPGCSLLEGPQAVVIPTPIPSPPPLDLQAVASGELVIDPVSDVAPRVDPEIQSLLGQVSRQQLVGYVQTLQNFQTRNTYSTVDDPAVGLGASRLWLYNEFIRVGAGRLLVQTDDFPVNYAGQVYNQQNIVATLPGVGPHPGVVVLAAHYDSRTIDPFDATSFAPGANDNGSGVAVLLEVARVLSSREWNQTVVFVAFAAEEQGRYGSNHYVTNEMLNGRIFDAMLNNDIVGGRPGITQSLRVFSPDPESSPGRQLARYIDYVSGLYVPQFTMTLENTADREGRFSDHITFLQAGVPAVRLTESQEDPNRQHNARDTWEVIDFNYLLQVTQLNLVAIANLIGAPPPPAAPVVAPVGDPGTYQLSWTPDPNAAGYAISFRPAGANSYPPFQLVNRQQAGNVAITGFDPNVRYYVSLAALDENGRISRFSLEVPVGP